VLLDRQPSVADVPLASDPLWTLPSPSMPEPAEHAATVELLDSLRERRGRRQRPLDLDEEIEQGEPDRLDAAIDSFLSQTHADGEDEAPYFGPLGMRPTPPRPTTAEPVSARRPELVRGQPPVQRYEDAPFEPADPPVNGAAVRGPRRLRADADVIVLPDEAAESTRRPEPARRASPPAAKSKPGGTPTGPDEDPDPTKPTPDKPTPSRRNRRASVPSWDDIVFGSKRE
jgi:hypothetical protein